MTDQSQLGAATAATAWWVEQLINPSFFVTTAEDDRYDPSAVDDRATLRAIADAHPVTDAQLATFAHALESIIMRNIDDDEYGLHVDYDPDPDLAEAASAAGIDYSRFPLKTHLWLHGGKRVTASVGYRAPEQVVWEPHESSA